MTEADHSEVAQPIARRARFHLPRPQWSARQLCAVTLIVAIGAAVWRYGFDFCDALIACVLSLMAVGLVRQSADVWRAFHARGDLLRDQRFGWRFEVFWRTAIAGLMLVYYFQAEASPGFIWNYEANYSQVTPAMLLALSCSSTLVAMLSNPLLRQTAGAPSYRGSSWHSWPGRWA